MGIFKDLVTSQLIDVIEWTDDSQNTMVYKYDMNGKEIMMGAQLTVRESQAAIFVNEGKLADVFQPGRYELSTQNMPILTKLKAWKFGFNSPFKSDVYFINTKQFLDRKWGTANPVMMRDTDFGMIRIRAFGSFAFRVKEPETFMKECFGTSSLFTVEGVEGQLKSMVVSGLSDAIAQSKIPALDIAANYSGLSQYCMNALNTKVEALGLTLTNFVIENVSLPEEVEKAMDKRTSMGVLGMPQMIHKFFAIRDEGSVKRATVISTAFALIVAGGAYFAGSFGRVVLAKIAAPDGAGTLYDLVASGAMSLDDIMPAMLTDPTVVGIPDAVQGLFVVLLLSASISTLTSLVLSSSSVVTLDLVGSVARLKPKDATLLMRVLCAAFVALSLAINFWMQDTPIVSLMSLSWGTIAGAFLAPFLYGLVWRGVTKAGAWAGVIGGALISLLPPLVAGDMSLAPMSGAAAMAAGLAIVPAVSLATRHVPGMAFDEAFLEGMFGKAQAGSEAGARAARAARQGA